VVWIYQQVLVGVLMEIENEYKSEFNIKNPPPMLKTWISALTKPTVENYRRLAAHKGITIGTPARWYFIALIVAAVLNYVFLHFFVPLYFPDMTFLSGIGSHANQNVLVIRGIIIFYFGFQVFAISIRFLLMSISLLFINWLADKNGAAGAFENFAFICIAWIAPLTIIFPNFYQTLFIYALTIMLRVMIFGFFMAITLRAIKELSVSKALLVTGVPVFIYLVSATLWLLFLLNLPID
jgi:hypothetical protein